MKRFEYLLIIGLVFIACERENDKEAAPSFNYGEVTDIDGNAYRTIQIGEQIWMVDNLKARHLNNGDEIKYITRENREDWGISSSPTCTWYQLNPQYADSLRKDGMLYNWYTTENDNVCPTGWRVPNDDDWNELFDYAESHGATDRKAAEKLKAKKGWGTSQNTGFSLNGTNEFGFEAKPAGYFGKIDGIWYFQNAGSIGTWWSIDTTVIDQKLIGHEEISIYDFANSFTMGYIDDTRNTSLDVHKWFSDWDYKKNGYSIRCIKE